MKVLAWILLVVILIGGGFMLYRAGFTHGAVSGGDLDFSFSRYAHSPHGMYATPYSRFFPGGMLFGLLFFFLIIGLFRRAFFGPRWGMHRMRGMDRLNWGERAEKWHAEQHARMDGKTSPEDAAPTDPPVTE